MSNEVVAQSRVAHGSELFLVAVLIMRRKSRERILALGGAADLEYIGSKVVKEATAARDPSARAAPR